MGQYFLHLYPIMHENWQTLNPLRNIAGPCTIYQKLQTGRSSKATTNKTTIYLIEPTLQWFFFTKHLFRAHRMFIFELTHWHWEGIIYSLMDKVQLWLNPSTRGFLPLLKIFRQPHTLKFLTFQDILLWMLLWRKKW